jgi:hypothetical protein
MKEKRKKYRLINDVVSHFKPFEVYGSAGTEVIILHDHLDMVIVKDDSGNIFHSRTDNLAEIKFGTLLTPVKTKNKIEQKSKVPRTSKRKTLPMNQINLF